MRARKVRRGASIDADFRAALQRLLAGNPTTKTVVGPWKAGKLRLSLSTIAAEAGHSRRLIASPSKEREALQQELLQAIGKAVAEPPKPRAERLTLRQQNERLHADVERLEADNRKLAEKASDWASAASILQQKLMRAQKDLARMRQRTQGTGVVRMGGTAAVALDLALDA